MAIGVVSEDNLGHTAFPILVYVQAGLNIIAIVFDLQLIFFHRWLEARHFSTFDYIMYKREHAEMKQQVESGDLT